MKDVNVEGNLDEIKIFFARTVITEKLKRIKHLIIYTFIKKHSINKLKMNDLIFFKNVGAYGASMSSTYNSRPIIPEIMVYKKHFGIVRNKENVIKQIAKEKIPNWILKIKS